MSRFRATLAYDGTAYAGFQKQASGIRTIQGELEQALERLCRKPVQVLGAGRTDTGVHATGQVIAFDVEWSHTDEALLRAINAHLPDDIALQDIAQQPGFHPRFDALSRTYRYTVVTAKVRQPLLLKRAWQMHGPLDFEAMNMAAHLLLGEHDFAAFGQAPQGDNTVREIFVSRWHQEAFPAGHVGTYEVEATAFLQHMVRRLVAGMTQVGRGLLSVEQFRAVFHSRDLAQVKGLAPPQGLVLVTVTYPDPGTGRGRTKLNSS